MAYQLRYESNEFTYFITIRTQCSRLWLVNNKKLHKKIVSYLAKYQKRYRVIVYAFVIQGNHVHLLVRFRRRNKAQFMRDFNSIVAKLIQRYAPGHEGGKVWERRYSEQWITREEDIEGAFFYCALQAVNSGLVPRISDYEGYNSFNDAIHNIKREYKVVDWRNYGDRKRYNKVLRLEDFIKVYRLKLTRLPGYKNLTQNEYAALFHKKLEERRKEIVLARANEGKGFLGKEVLNTIVPGQKPYKTKKSTRWTPRPIIFTLCNETRQKFLSFYFELRNLYKEASKKFLKDEKLSEFPPWTYQPPKLNRAATLAIKR